jgi:hypothetical protein
LGEEGMICLLFFIVAEFAIMVGGRGGLGLIMALTVFVDCQIPGKAYVLVMVDGSHNIEVFIDSQQPIWGMVDVNHT